MHCDYDACREYLNSFKISYNKVCQREVFRSREHLLACKCTDIFVLVHVCALYKTRLLISRLTWGNLTTLQYTKGFNWESYDRSQSLNQMHFGKFSRKIGNM